jgi:hypothetical protein
MPFVPKTYDVNSPQAKFYSSSAVVGSRGYNSKIISYYAYNPNSIISGAVDMLLHTEEIFGGKIYSRTISGSNYPKQWPLYDYSVTYDPWEEATYS